MPPVYKDTTLELSEANRVVLHRFTEARLYGFTKIEAMLFAESSLDVGDLRRLIRLKCPPAQAAKILL